MENERGGGFSVKDLEDMGEEEFLTLFERITEDQAEDSEMGGDSDPEDEISHVLTSPRNSVRRSAAENNHDSDPVDAVADPTYIERIMEADCSSDDNHDIPDIQSPDVTPFPTANNYKWRKQRHLAPPEFTFHKFSQYEGNHVEVDLSSPNVFFLNFVTHAILNHMVDESNKYARQQNAALDLSIE